MANKISGVIENVTVAADIKKAINDLLGVLCSLTKPSSTFYFQDYEGQRSGNEWGERVSEREVGCGRKMLRMYDNNLPYFGGRTRFADGSKTPNYYDAREYPFVSRSRIKLKSYLYNFPFFHLYKLKFIKFK